MITAKEALEISASLDSTKVAALLERADRSIRAAAAEGEYNIRLMFGNNECSDALAQKVIGALKQNGFNVLYNSWNDMRDGSSYHQFDVSW